MILGEIKHCRDRVTYTVTNTDIMDSYISINLIISKV